MVAIESVERCHCQIKNRTNSSREINSLGESILHNGAIFQRCLVLVDLSSCPSSCPSSCMSSCPFSCPSNCLSSCPSEYLTTCG